MLYHDQCFCICNIRSDGNNTHKNDHIGFHNMQIRLRRWSRTNTGSRITKIETIPYNVNQGRSLNELKKQFKIWVNLFRLKIFQFSSIILWNTIQTNKPPNCIHSKNQLIEFYKMVWYHTLIFFNFPVVSKKR